tara:strand:+ start:1584 stop:3023 length:1440 start_codon:yes stop_codon:yes gene_type:complete
MRNLPLSIGTIHFVGVGGIGMSGIAEVMHNLGYKVQGSDQVENSNVCRLRDLGVHVASGHSSRNLGEAEVVVTSSAIPDDNPELVEARGRLVPVVRRAEMLAELMRLKWSIAVGGTHGKTTTTSLIAAVLDAAGHDPTVINGGIINAYGTNARLGGGDWMVVEADESDGTFIRLPATIAVVTNIDPEHLDFYENFDAERDAFKTFIDNVPFYGFAVLCVDHPEVQAMIGLVSDRKIVTYGRNPLADVRAVDVELTAAGSCYTVEFADRLSGSVSRMEKLELPMVGAHNVQNSLAAIAIANELGISHAITRSALSEFRGVRRRFTKIGDVDGVSVIDDYAHHPAEISAVLAAARQAYSGRVIAVVQPHRYSRLESLFEEFCSCFNDADVVMVADVYAAGEDAVDGVDRDVLIEGLRRHGHRQVVGLSDPSSLAVEVGKVVVSGDVVLCLGAGSITQWAQALPGELEQFYAQDSVKRAVKS